MTAVTGFSAGPVEVLRVPRTTTGPHLVVFERHNRFYGRSNGGKFLFGIDDIRAVFNVSSDTAERAFRLRDARIAAVMAGDTPVKAKGGALLLLVVPHGALSGTSQIDPKAVRMEQIPLPMSGGANSGYVAEGVVLRADQGYSLVMRTGAVEGVYDFYREANPEHRLVPTLKLEREVVRFTRQAVALLQALDVMAPYHVFVALLGMKEYPLAAPTEFSGVAYYERRFDRDLLTLPDVVLPEADVSDLVARLQPMFDGMWQAVGYRCDPYYDSGEATKW
jgi:hypothetical protein